MTEALRPPLPDAPEQFVVVVEEADRVADLICNAYRVVRERLYRDDDVQFVSEVAAADGELVVARIGDFQQVDEEQPANTEGCSGRSRHAPVDRLSHRRRKLELFDRQGAAVRIDIKDERERVALLSPGGAADHQHRADDHGQPHARSILPRSEGTSCLRCRTLCIAFGYAAKRRESNLRASILISYLNEGEKSCSK